MPCPWTGGETRLSCKNDAKPVIDPKKLDQFRADGVDFQVRLNEAATRDSGVCAGMTIKWCEQVFRGESGLQYPGASQLGLVATDLSSQIVSPGESVCKLHGDYSLEYARRLFKPANDSEAKSKKRAAQEATARSLSLCATRRYSGPPDDSFFRKVRDFLQQGDLVLLLSIRIMIQGQNAALKQVSGWHAMGVSPKAGAKSIFDPNWGLFAYTDDAKLLEALRRGLLNYFTRKDAAALKVDKVKLATVTKGHGFQEWQQPEVDEFEAMLAALRGPAVSATATPENTPEKKKWAVNVPNKPFRSLG
jgi:hypothetical protein